MKILWIHGFNGKGYGETSKMLKYLLPEAEIIAPQFSNDPERIKDEIHLAKETKPDLILATSYGAFIALLTPHKGIKIVHNPCMRPTKTLPDIGVNLTKKGQKLLDKYEDKIPMKGDYTNTYGLFASNDTICQFKRDFDFKFEHAGEVFTGSHYINGLDDVKVIFNKINSLRF
jgi:hypothetical protein